MRSNIIKSVLTKSGLAAGLLLFGGGAAFAQQQINLTAAPTTAAMPDGTVVPMWGYTCGALAAGSTATCAASNPSVVKTAAGTSAAVQTGWSPVVITVPTGQGLTINLTNNLAFNNGNSVPTSITIVGLLGGGLGGGGKTMPSPSHTTQTVTWPIAATGATNVPPPQGPRVQSFGTEVAAGATTALTWTNVNLNPGTYLIESGTHPSIQGPMGLYGILVVTSAPTATGGTETAAGCAYPGPSNSCTVSYDAEVPILLSEIDPVQNSAVSAAVNLSGFKELNVWSGQPGGCGNQLNADGTPNPSYGTCYPPAVNYLPLYYTINGVPFNKTSASNSLFPVSPATLAPKTGTGTATGNVLVRLVNAGLRMHVPAIVGSQTGVAPSGGTVIPTGFSLMAEDGNPLPGIPRVQSEVFMPAGKVYDVMINGPASGAPALAIYDRELSLSGNAINRDAGMLAYISINGGALPAAIGADGTTSAFQTAKANPDSFVSLLAGQSLSVSDPSKGLIANDVNVYGVALDATKLPSHGTVTVNSNGTFTYVPSGTTTTSDSFGYCANGTTQASATPICTTVTLGAAPVEVATCVPATTTTAASGICLNNMMFTSTVASYLSIKPPGVLAVDQDGAGYPLSVVVPAGGIALAGPGTGTLTMNSNGGFTAAVSMPGTYTFSYSAQNSQGTQSSGPAGTATVTLVFPTGSGLTVSIIDGQSKVALPTGLSGYQDYRWIIEEDRTFYVNPNCTANPPPAGCPTYSATNVEPEFGVNFHTSYMPFVAQGCTGPLSCESGQTLLGQPAVCDVGNGACRTTASQQTAVLPGQVALDPTKRYYISIMPGDAAQPFIAGYGGAPDCSATGQAAGNCGYGMGGAEIPASCTPVAPATTCTATGAPSVTILSQASPYQTGLLSVIVFEDDFPLNGEQDAGGGIDVLAPNEPGLGGFNIQLWDPMGANGDFTGQMTYDMFNQPLSNSLDGTIDPSTQLNACPITQQGQGITGMIVTCPKFESDGVTQSPLQGQAVINNLMQGRWEVIATPGADRIARGEEWLQTNTLDGQKAHDTFIRIGEPSFFQEFGPAGYHAAIGFANPKIINGRLKGVCAGTDVNLTIPAGQCSNTVTGHITSERMSRTPDERLYGSGDHKGFYWTQCYVSFGDPDGEDFAFTKCAPDGSFTLTGLPPGTWRVTVFDQWNDMLVDGLSTPVAIVGPHQSVNMGEIATNQWQINLYTRTFVDDNKDGISQSDEAGIPLINTTIRYRDGSLGNNLGTDFTGTANFNETFPLFNWYVVETDVTRYKNTGTHVVYDAGGPADGTTACGNGSNGFPPCGKSAIGANLANTAEIFSLPNNGTTGNLRVPGAVYCAGADCIGHSIQSGPSSSDPPSVCTTSTSTGTNPVTNTTCSTQLSTGRIDPPWLGGTEGFQGYSGQNNFLEFGKELYAPGENGGIKGHVIYASTRPFDDPQMLVQTQWVPLVPHVTINLYQESTAADGITPTLTLVDSTQTSSFDDWAQGFHKDASGNTVPNMNCPGQSTADLFYFTLQNQPNYLDYYNNVLHGTGAVTPLPYQSQYKCYDGMHNWNQLQPAPYDGMYQFPSVTATDATTGKPTATNCKICKANAAVPATDLYYGLPQLPVGKYVVEVVVPPGFELVKEEDKNILIGDNYIAPVSNEFGGLGNIFIIPDQASVASAYTTSGIGYNANNAGNPTQSLGAAPNNSIVPGFVPEPTWPCVGQARIVPDYISLFPQSGEVAPFAGATRHLCDRKEVTLGDQMGAIAKFYVFTSTHIASKYTGVITDDFTSEFDPFSPQFGEKFSPPNMPVSIKDWTGSEISRVYSDQWGTYNGMTYSTWEVNPPNPTGYSPTMMVFCMNDPGTGPTPDPLYNASYSQFCYELPFMPGTTQYLDTPVVPTSAFVGAGYNNPDCDYPDYTPAVASVLNTVTETNASGSLTALSGPWVAGAQGAIDSISLTNGGSGYTTSPTIGFTGGGGTGASATANVVRAVVTVNVSSGGSGYTSAPTVGFTGGGGTGATATATIASGVTSANVTAEGSGYTSRPTVTFSGGGGSGAAATATISNGNNHRVTGITITSSGSGYTSAPSISISGGGGTGAKATAVISGHVTTVTVTNGGSGYTNAPNVTFSGGGVTNRTGTAARATASIAGYVASVTLVSSGSGYTSAPSISFTGGGGSGAAATASVETGGQLTINALGDTPVGNYGYSGPTATNAPFNAKTITRHYNFGAQCTSPTAGNATCNTLSSVTIGGKTATIASWSLTQIVVNVPGGVPNCALQQQTQYGGSNAQCGELTITAGNGKQSIDAVTVTVGGKAPTLLAAGATIQSGIDAAAPGDLVIVPAGTYNEMLLMWKPVRLQGVAAASSVINANTHPAGKLLTPWRAHVNCLFGLALNGQPLNPGSDLTFPPAEGAGSVRPPTIKHNPYDATSAQSCPAAGWNYFVGSTNNPQIDRIPLEGIVGWDTTLNGNLAQLLNEPSLMGAYEGAAITVLGKGVRYPGAGADTTNAQLDPVNPATGQPYPLTNIFGTGTDTEANSYIAHEGQMPVPTIELTGNTYDCAPPSNGGVNPFPSNFQCNPSRIDGLSVTDSSQGGGGIFVHGWAHNLEIANNRIHSNTGTFSGGIVVGQGESPDALLSGNGGDPVGYNGGTLGGFDQQPWTCLPGASGQGNLENVSPPGTFANQQLPFCFNLSVNVHHNSVTHNSSIGDELFSGTPAGAGGVTFCTGADYYKFNYNWVCGNLSTGDGGGLAHVGFIYNGDIEHNQILFNQATNPTIPTNGGGIIVMGAAPDGTPPGAAAGTECGSVTDVDCAPGLPDGTGPGLVINANLIMGNAADAGSGGGLRLQSVNGTEVSFFPRRPLPGEDSPGWNSVQVTNNIIANNVAGWDGGGVSLQDALVVNVINNTIASNDTTASSGVLFNTIGAPDASAPGSNCIQTGSTTKSCPQPAGLVTTVNSSNLTATFAGLRLICPPNNPNCTSISTPYLANDVFWQNRSFYIGVGALSPNYQQNVVALYNALSGTPAANQPAVDASTTSGGSTTITGGTGACTPGATYWDLGVRGDTGPGNHSSGHSIGATYSVLTNTTEAGTVSSTHNLTANPDVVSQYCNGSRIPPEAASGSNGAGWQVPPGISDATVPNPPFTLYPIATVDEGNNWVNIAWGPLALTNPVTGTTLGNYALASGSPAIDYIATNAPTYAAAPSTDFFGNPRPDVSHTAIDIGAVEFQGTGTGVAPATASIAPNPLTITLPAGTNTGVGTVTLTNTAAAGGASVTVTNVMVSAGSLFTGVFNKVIGSDNCSGTTLVPGGTCTVQIRFSVPMSATRGVNRTATITFTDNASGTPQIGNVIGHAN